MTTDSDETDELEMEDVPTYIAPRSKAPHPDDTPLDPFNQRALDRQLRRTPHTGIERDLMMVAKKINTTEAIGQKHLRRTATHRGNDLETASINPNREMIQNPAGYMAAKKAKHEQGNLKTHYRQWATLCEQYFNRLREMISNESESDVQ